MNIVECIVLVTKQRRREKELYIVVEKDETRPTATVAPRQLEWMSLQLYNEITSLWELFI